MGRRLILATMLVAMSLTLGATTASAQSIDKKAASDVAQIDAAVAAQGAPPVASNDDVSTPPSGARPVTVGDPLVPALAIGLPASGTAERAGHTTIFDGTAADSSVAVQPTARGLRVLVHIDRPRRAVLLDVAQAL